MTTTQHLLDVARAEIGYVEGGGPHGNDGNIVKYWTDEDPALQGQSWCAAFVSWCFTHAGAPLPAIDRPYGYMNCQDAYNYAKRHGKVITAAKVRPGDISLFVSNGVAHHTGIVERAPLNGSFVDIEGNTSPGSAGSQYNGGGVYRRTRSTTGVVFVRFVELSATAPTPIVEGPAQEIDVQLKPVTFMLKTDGAGRAWTVTPLPYHIDKVVSAKPATLMTSQGQEPRAATVGLADNNGGTDVAVNGWFPNSEVCVRLMVIA